MNIFVVAFNLLANAFRRMFGLYLSHHYPCAVNVYFNIFCCLHKRELRIDSDQSEIHLFPKLNLVWRFLAIKGSAWGPEDFDLVFPAKSLNKIQVTSYKLQNSI